MPVSRVSALTLRLTQLLLWLVLLLPGPNAQAARGECSGLPSGRLCPVTRDTNPNDCVEPRCIEEICEPDYPVSGPQACDDGDGNPCTLAACGRQTGVCAPAAPAPLGAFCPDTDGNSCTRAGCNNGQCIQSLNFLPDQTTCGASGGDACAVARCLGGQCVQGGGMAVPPMGDLATVEVSARSLVADFPEAYTDCCWLCSPQSLEAVVPSPTGPQRVPPGAHLPERQKFCGKVVRYGVNDELADPRDMMLNMVPSPGFEHFVAGLLNTACSPLVGAHEDRFGHNSCDGNACRSSAPSGPRCIHAEVTPAEQFYGRDARFLPIHSSTSRRCNGKVTTGQGGSVVGGKWECSSDLEPSSDWSDVPPVFGDPSPTGREACVYGVYAIDHGSHRPNQHRDLCCSPDPGHDRPEIHPFDAVWFHHPDGRPGWMFGVFQDDSNRYSYSHCSSEHNRSQWSQAPRDLTFRFPFQLPRASTPIKACLRHARVPNFAGSMRPVTPLNVTTAAMPVPLEEVKTLTDANGSTALVVVEQVGAESETQVRVEGCVTGSQVKGFLTVRVAIGCPRGQRCPGLLRDTGDPGSGFYYAELFFGDDCGP